jgi:hypothetical protein
MVGAGLEPARPCGQRILSPQSAISAEFLKVPKAQNSIGIYPYRLIRQYRINPAFTLVFSARLHRIYPEIRAFRPDFNLRERPSDGSWIVPVSSPATDSQ